MGEYFAGLLVEDVLVIELKCAGRPANEHIAQCLNYPRASLCLPVNFRKPKVEWKRIVRRFQIPELVCPSISRTLHSETPEVVEFAVSPQVGQAVLAFARFYSSSGPKFSAGGQASTACPTCETLAIEGNGSAHFPCQAEIAGRDQEV